MSTLTKTDKKFDFYGFYHQKWLKKIRLQWKKQYSIPLAEIMSFLNVYKIKNTNPQYAVEKWGAYYC